MNAKNFLLGILSVCCVAQAGLIIDLRRDMNAITDLHNHWLDSREYQVNGLQRQVNELAKELRAQREVLEPTVQRVEWLRMHEIENSSATQSIHVLQDELHHLQSLVKE